ncbi:MAG: hypothetical protein H0T68_03490 [Gemmatimonadales bacterium]|nr:hypothetical protein [Gemmatimonadales bacterium]
MREADERFVLRPLLAGRVDMKAPVGNAQAKGKKQENLIRPPERTL